MPPRKQPPLPESARALLRRWVAEGARGPERDTSILKTLVTPELPPASGRPAPITAAAVSADGRRLALGRFRRVELRDPETRVLLRELSGLPGKVNSLEFSRDGRTLVVATGVAGLSGEARILDLEGDAAARVFGGHRDILYDATLSPDGSLLATAGYDRRIRLWNRESGALLREIDVHKGAIFDLEFSPDGAVLASASADETVKLWRVPDGLRLDTLNQPQGEQRAVAFTPDGEHILSAGADRRIHLWRFVSRTQPAINPPVESRFAHESPIVALRLLDGGKIAATAAADGTLKIWSLPDLVEIASYGTQADVVSSISGTISTARASSGAFLVTRLDGSLETYSIAPGRSGPSRRPETAPPRQAMSSGEPRSIVEAEPNDTPPRAGELALPVEIEGRIGESGDVDLFRFRARAGEELCLEVNAARQQSDLDSKVEVLDGAGRSIEQIALQAVRDSWFTFRGKDSNTSDDFRLHNWREMELDEYLYAAGEVVRLWLYPRGPDSGFKVYPGGGNRQTFFSTTALSHPLGAPCYIVKPLAPGADPPPVGLPIYHLFYENDDDPSRRNGRDSLLLFTAPADGEYLARISDVRGFGGEKNFHYRLSIRERRPDFSIAIEGKGAGVSPGSGRELGFTATRREGFDGPIRIDIEDLPAGFSATSPIVVEAGQISARGVLYASESAPPPSKAACAAVKVSASATIRGEAVRRSIGDLGAFTVGPAAKLRVQILPAAESAELPRDREGRLVFEIRPGETLRARVRAERRDFTARIDLGKEDAGRNLPHGLFVDNIGLNGLLIVEGQSQREFFITAAPIARPGSRLFHLRATADGGQCSPPAVIRVLAALRPRVESGRRTRRF